MAKYRYTQNCECTIDYQRTGAKTNTGVNKKNLGFEDAIPEGNTEVGDSEEEEAHDNSEEAAQSRSTFKYKSSHPEELIIGSKDTPIRTSSAFRNESLIRLISQIEHTSIDEALTDDGWIVAMQE
ncbi:hypothetical protein MTR_5g055360 [Medicago truncatula]|uniref:Uncharacterized protein n=1 Tax=Medicago truncatula TaxID=3880 RepID=G7JZG5_MEDTR|nr:hypothetical protein MTR_5g055360 [Medicago truncatula]